VLDPDSFVAGLLHELVNEPLLCVQAHEPDRASAGARRG
jgi:hypothetical protein